MSSSFVRSEYPARIRHVINGIWMIVLLMNGVEYILAWVRVLYGFYSPMFQLPFVGILAPYRDPFRFLLIAHVGLFIALLTTRAIAFLAARITLRNDGLLFETALEWRFIPFSALRGVHSVELKTNNRFVVWIDSTCGLPLEGWLASLLFGRWMTSGFMFTSDLAGFDTLIATVTEQLRAKYPNEQDFALHFVEDEPTWLLAMLNSPRGTVRALVAENALPIDETQARWQMASVASALLMPLAIGGIIHLQIPWSALAVLAIAAIEFPVASSLLSALPISDIRRIDFSHALRAYPLTQLPRWGIALGFTLLIIAGAHPYFLFLSAAVALMLGCITVLWFVREWFEVELGEALIGLAGTVFLQFALYAVFALSISWF